MTCASVWEGANIAPDTGTHADADTDTDNDTEREKEREEAVICRSCHSRHNTNATPSINTTATHSIVPHISAHLHSRSYICTHT